MPGGSESRRRGSPRPRRTTGPLWVIAVVLAWLLFSGGSLTDWFSLRGPVPGTGGMIAKGHLVLLALILIIANFVLRMPREGGPVADEDDDDDEPDEDEDDDEDSGRHWWE